MQKTKEISLYITIFLWAVIVGGVAYSHLVYFPAYLPHLPASNQLITGKFGLRDENFWMRVHPLVILFTTITLVLNWRLKQRRKLILISACIYALAILFTAVYFVPELLAFAKTTSSSLDVSTLYVRAQNWQHRSWIRGTCLGIGFILLLMALQKNKNETVN